MPLFFVSYDLRKEKDYQKLYDQLESLGAVRVLESQWCFKRDETTVSELRDFFKKFIDSDDGVCVTEVTHWATAGTLGTPKKLK